MSEWRTPQERDELVERVVRAERERDAALAELRRRIVDEELYLAGHPTEAALVARVKDLEGVIVRQNELRMSGKRRSA